MEFKAVFTKIKYTRNASKEITFANHIIIVSIGQISFGLNFF